MSLAAADIGISVKLSVVEIPTLINELRNALGILLKGARKYRACRALAAVAVLTRSVPPTHIST